MENNQSENNQSENDSRQQQLMPGQKRIALVAHDRRKNHLLQWSRAHVEQLKDHQLYSTMSTGELLEKNLPLSIHKFLSGPLGGDQQIGSFIAEGKIDFVIFFWDPLTSMPHDTDVKALIRLCSVWNILLACSESTADFIIESPLFHQKYVSQLHHQLI